MNILIKFTVLYMKFPFIRCSPFLASMYFICREGGKLVVLRFFGGNENAIVILRRVLE